MKTSNCLKTKLKSMSFKNASTVKNSRGFSNIKSLKSQIPLQNCQENRRSNAN